MPQVKRSVSNTFSSFDGTKIYYEIYGSTQNKKTILFLHGLGGNLTAWEPQRRFFEKQGYTTIALDLRGHGLSGRPRKKSAYAIENFAHDVAIFLHIQQLKDVTIVGQCLGGITALLLNSKFHVEPKALILVGTNYKVPTYLQFVERQKLLSGVYYLLSQMPPLGKPGHMAVDKYRGTHDLDVRRVSEDIFYTTAQSYIAICSNLFAFNGEAELKNISCPTLIIHGSKDLIFSKKVAMQLHKRLKNSQLVLVPDGNHILVLNNPRELNHIIESYLNKNSRPLTTRTSPYWNNHV